MLLLPHYVPSVLNSQRRLYRQSTSRCIFRYWSSCCLRCGFIFTRVLGHEAKRYHERTVIKSNPRNDHSLMFSIIYTDLDTLDFHFASSLSLTVMKFNNMFDESLKVQQGGRHLETIRLPINKQLHIHLIRPSKS